MTGTLARYFGRRFFNTLIAVIGGLFALVVLLDYVEMMRRMGDIPGVSAVTIAKISLFRVPQIAERILPFCVLIGAMSSFLDLSRRLELVVSRAAGMRTTPKEFTEQLNKQGLQPDSIKARIRAELVWGQIIRGRYQSSFQFSDKDVQARLASKRPEDASSVGYDYTLRPILFVVPRGSPQAVLEERRKEAEALRTRFQSCEQGLPLARGMLIPSSAPARGTVRPRS